MADNSAVERAHMFLNNHKQVDSRGPSDAEYVIRNLLDRIAELEKDRERLDWLRYRIGGSSSDAGETWELAVFLPAKGELRGSEMYPPVDLRPVIDAAMASERQELES